MVVKIMIELFIEIIKAIYKAIRSLFNRRMTFLKTLTKDGWTIYVYSLSKGRYMIEYSDDGFGSKERKEYEDLGQLIEVLSKRFSREQIKFLYD